MRVWLLVLKLEISYNKSYNKYLGGFLVSFKGFFLKIIFLHAEIFEFP